MPIPRLLGVLLAHVAVLGAAGCGSLGSDSGIAGLGGGPPPDAPERAAVQPPYPNVYDVPPPREAKLIPAAEQNKIEAELAASRQRVNAQGDALQKERIGTDR